MTDAIIEASLRRQKELDYILDDDINRSAFSFVTFNDTAPIAKEEKINIGGRQNAATIIARHCRGYLARHQYKLLQEKKTKVLFIDRRRVEDYLIELQARKMLVGDVAKSLSTNDILVTGTNMTARTKLKRYTFPRSLQLYIMSLSDKEIGTRIMEMVSLSGLRVVL